MRLITCKDSGHFEFSFGSKAAQRAIAAASSEIRWLAELPRPIGAGELSSQFGQNQSFELTSNCSEYAEPIGLNASIRLQGYRRQTNPGAVAKKTRRYAIKKFARKIAEDIVLHFMGRGFPGKAMVVSIDKASTVRMFDKVRKHWNIQRALL